MPFTSGSSGPTSIMSIAFAKQAVAMASKSDTAIGKLVPHKAVPALPGAINKLVHNRLWLSFHAKVCSRPPEPIKRIFIDSSN